jgi:hypothetical protein
MYAILFCSPIKANRQIWTVSQSGGSDRTSDEMGDCPIHVKQIHTDGQFFTVHRPRPMYHNTVPITSTLKTTYTVETHL